jgi:hypothetical protein
MAMVGEDWDTTAGLWSDKTGTRLPAYGRTRLGHDSRHMAGQDWDTIVEL